METFLSLLVGLGLSAACGFRVFVPLLIMSIAALSGHLTLAPGFAWIGSWPALIAFAVATGLEIAGYYVPWVDNFLDTVASPSAVVAGTLATAAMISNMDPFLKWTLAAIAGGGLAGLVQGATVLTRGASTLTTGGLLNPVVATAELGGSIVAGMMALVAPVLGLLMISLVLVFVMKRFRQPRTGMQISSPT
ncbi:MAG: DUF4126 domain-containing protein [Opitutaceae bacterium]|nr:DUF4126 domain-containing protein [Verrucomicrobiales bacterium]